MPESLSHPCFGGAPSPPELGSSVCRSHPLPAINCRHFSTWLIHRDWYLPKWYQLSISVQGSALVQKGSKSNSYTSWCTFWCLQFLRKPGSNFQNTGLEIEPRFPAKPLRRKSVPNLGRSWGESSLQPFGCKLVRLQLGQIQVASTARHLHLLHGHRPRSRPDQIQNPKSKLQTARLDFGFWISDFGFWIFNFWILDFGFWILDFVWISLVFVLFVAAPNGPVWILDLGFWISDFGFWILDFGFWISDFGFWITSHRLDPA